MLYTTIYTLLVVVAIQLSEAFAGTLELQKGSQSNQETISTIGQKESPYFEDVDASAGSRVPPQPSGAEGGGSTTHLRTT